MLRHIDMRTKLLPHRIVDLRPRQAQQITDTQRRIGANNQHRMVSVLLAAQKILRKLP